MAPFWRIPILMVLGGGNSVGAKRSRQTRGPLGRTGEAQSHSHSCDSLRLAHATLDQNEARAARLASRGAGVSFATARRRKTKRRRIGGGGGEPSSRKLTGM